MKGGTGGVNLSPPCINRASVSRVERESSCAEGAQGRSWQEAVHAEWGRGVCTCSNLCVTVGGSLHLPEERGRYVLLGEGGSVPAPASSQLLMRSGSPR